MMLPQSVRPLYEASLLTIMRSFHVEHERKICANDTHQQHIFIGLHLLLLEP